MNAVLFQFIEPRKIPWNAARRNNTQMEKEKTGDAGIITLVLIENKRYFSRRFFYYPPSGLLVLPVRGGEVHS